MSILTDFQEILGMYQPGAIIAGGAVRDFLYGKPPKDIDVFIPLGCEPDIKSTNLWKEVKWDYVFKDKMREYEALGNLRGLDQFFWKDHTVQLISIHEEDAYEKVRTFDLGICKCYFDGYLVYLDDFIKDKEDGLITNFKPDSPRCVDRAHRIAEKLGMGVR